MPGGGFQPVFPMTYEHERQARGLMASSNTLVDAAIIDAPN
jgi:hypothetical protein